MGVLAYEVRQRLASILICSVRFYILDPLVSILLNLIVWEQRARCIVAGSGV